MKKVIGILVALIMLVSFFMQSAFALTPPKFMINVGSVEGEIRSIVTVPVRFVCAEQFPVNNIDFSLSYDKDILELVSVNSGEIVTNTPVNFSSSIDSGKVSLLFADKSAGSMPISKTGVFANLNFKIKKAGTSKIDLVSFGAVNDNKLNPIQYNFSWGSVIGKEMSGYEIVSRGQVRVNKEALTDVTVDLGPIGTNLISEIKNGAGILVKGTDYSVSESIITIKKDYLSYYFAKFPEQNLRLSIIYSDGYDSPLCIFTGPSSLPEISTSSTTYNVGFGEDIAVKTELNGNYISSVRNGYVSLVPRIDYTYSPADKTIIIRKNYLAYYFSKNPENTKLKIYFTGGSGFVTALTLSVSPVYPAQPKNELSPSQVSFDEGIYQDIVLKKSSANATIAGITISVDGKQLFSIDPKNLHTDRNYYYTEIGDTVILNHFWPEGESSTLRFDFNQGNSVDFNITVTKRKPLPPITVTVGNTNISSDNTATIPVYINGITGFPINNLDFKLSYDEKSAQIESVTAGDIVNPPQSLSYNAVNGTLILMFTNDTQGSAQISKDGVFAYIKIKLNPGISYTTIKFLENGGCSDERLYDIPVNFVDGSASIPPLAAM